MITIWNYHGTEKSLSNKICIPARDELRLSGMAVISAENGAKNFRIGGSLYRMESLLTISLPGEGMQCTTRLFVMDR